MMPTKGAAPLTVIDVTTVKRLSLVRPKKLRPENRRQQRSVQDRPPQKTQKKPNDKGFRE